MSSVGTIIQIGKNREIPAMLLNVFKGWTADIVRTGGLGEECRGIKAQMITETN